MPDKKTLLSIRALVLYMAPEEGRHFAENEKPRDHIFRDVMRVAKWLDLKQKDIT